MLNVLVEETRLSFIEDVIFSETTTLGIRYMHASCHRLAREFEQVDTKWGLLTVKVGYHQGKLVQYAPEFKECEQVAREYQVPLKLVYEEVRTQFMLQRKKPPLMFRKRLLLLLMIVSMRVMMIMVVMVIIMGMAMIMVMLMSDVLMADLPFSDERIHFTDYDTKNVRLIR